MFPSDQKVMIFFFSIPAGFGFSFMQMMMLCSERA